MHRRRRGTRCLHSAISETALRGAAGFGRAWRR
jgi:hypothetical protein